MDLFTLVARLTMDASDYEKKVNSSRTSFMQLGSAISAKAVAIGTLTARVVEKAASMTFNLGKSAIEAAAKVEAENAQFTASFGELQGSAKKAFDSVGKETGILATRLRTVGTKAFSQFTGAGLDGVEALGMMEEYTKLAADAAAYYDISLEDADAKLRSFLRGNTEAGDAIGLFTSESQRNTYALEKYGQKWANLTEAQKQMLMLDVASDIYKQSGAMGQAARESESWANVVANIKKAWEETIALAGSPIKFAITPILQGVTEWLKDPENELKVEQFGIGVANAINGFFSWVLNPTFPTWEEVKTGAKEKLDAINDGLKTSIDWGLGKLGMPDSAEIVTQVSEWWNAQGTGVLNKIKGVMTWTFGAFLKPAFDGISTWWAETGADDVKKILNWTLGAFGYPSLDGIKEWWSGQGDNASEKLKNILVWTLGTFVAPALDGIKTWWEKTGAEGTKNVLNWTLGAFGAPSLDEIKEWWIGQGDNAYTRLKSVLVWALGNWEAPNLDGLLKIIGSWWEKTAKPGITGIVQWTFGELIVPAWVDLWLTVYNWWNDTIRPGIKRIAEFDLGDINFPTLNEIVTRAQTWWDTVKENVSKVFTAVITPVFGGTPYEPENPVSEEEAYDIISGPSYKIPNKTKITITEHGATGSFATGLDYVPYNDYFARLHEGEAVLTKAEAEAWRSGRGIESPRGATAQEIAAAVASALDGSFVNMDRERVGRLVLPTVSQGIASGMRSRRYAT